MTTPSKNTTLDDGPVLQDNARKTGFSRDTLVITDHGPMKIGDVIDVLGEKKIRVLAYYKHEIEVEPASCDPSNHEEIPAVHSNFMFEEPSLGRELIIHKSKYVSFTAGDTQIKAGNAQKYVYTGTMNLTGTALSDGIALIDQTNYDKTIDDPDPSTGIFVDNVSHSSGDESKEVLCDLKFDGADGYVLACGIIALHENYYVDALDETNMKNHKKHD